MGKENRANDETVVEYKCYKCGATGEHIVVTGCHLFLGRPVSYWYELQRRIEIHNREIDIQDIIRLKIENERMRKAIEKYLAKNEGEYPAFDEMFRAALEGK